MASASILFLRPPPNVEFVQGFPGIPASSPERQACVRGVVELRPSGSAVKARWVKVELRKVETLPGGGQANTYIDFIGESPVALWQSQSEWEELRARDFPFQIRIPEALPPSIALERNAGIKYELVASVLTKGKRGLLRREATPVVSTSCQIIVDKHELHSAWPIYAQPESRSRTVDGYTLTVNRTHTAYGPGDRIAVQTLIKNETMQSNQVRYYEFSLLQHVAYRTTAQAGGKRNGPPPRTTAIQEQRIPITMASPLHPGMQVKAELSLQVPLNHTTTTVLWAQRIEVAFTIHVKGVLTGGQQLQIDLPITMSNWTRAQSMDAVRRIGNVPNLTLQPSGPPPAIPPSVSPFNQPPASSPPSQAMGWNSPPAAADLGQRPMSMMPPSTGPQPNPNFIGGWADPARPTASTMTGATPRADVANEFGAMSPGGTQRPMTLGGIPSSMSPPNAGGFPPNPEPSPPVAGLNGSDDGRGPVGPGRQARRMTATVNPAARFTVVNPTLGDLDELGPNANPPGPSHPGGRYMSAEEEKRRLREAMDRVDRGERDGGSKPSASLVVGPPNGGSSSAGSSAHVSSTSPSPQPKQYLSAEDEKRQMAEQRRRFDEARERALRMQANADGPEFDQHVSDGYTTPPPMANGSSSMAPPRQNSQWMSAAEEKERLSYANARSAVERTQNAAMGSGLRPGTSGSNWSGDQTHAPEAGGSGAGMSAGKALYQSAMASMRPPQGQLAYANGSSSSQYPTASDEKEALRFKRAMEAAKHSQMGPMYAASPREEAGPVPYEDLFPSGPSPSTVPVAPLNVGRSRSPTNGQFPGANGDASHSPLDPSRPLNAREEKEKMRMMYQAQDAAARQPGGATVAGAPLVPPSHALSAASPPPPATPGRPLTAAEEKAILRAQYANEDGARGSKPAATPGPPVAPYSPNNYADMPPSSTNGFHDEPPAFSPPKPMTAAEEKAALRAKYAAEEAGGNPTPPANRGPPPAPPPPRQMSTGPGPSAPPPRPVMDDDDDLYETPGLRDPGVALGKQRAPTPPPLPNKPPAEYYQVSGTPSASDRPDYFTNPSSSPRDSNPNFIDVRPFSPFSVGFDYASVPPPPPLPPKPIM